MITVLEDWCKGCNLCIDKCPVDALEDSEVLNRKGIYPPRLKEDNRCTNCRLCELLCPDFAITVTPDDDKEDDEEESKSKLIIGGIVNEV